MKAIVQNGYGSTDFLSVKDVPRPAAEENRIVVKVAAASVNAGDLFGVMGAPWMIRMDIGLPRPKDHIPGWDIAGIVESVGSSVSRFRPGDGVYGSTKSAFAEYAAGDENIFEFKPEKLTSEEAAALPTAALTALQRLRDGGDISDGQKVPSVTSSDPGVGI